MSSKLLSLILEEKIIENLKKDAFKKGLSVEEYVIKILKGFIDVQ